MNTANAITMQSVESSQLAAIGHCAETNTLAIEFKGKNGPGSLYHYANFTAADFAAFAGAESVGKHFYAKIKPFAEQFPCQRIEQDDAERARLQSLADQHLADGRERAKDEQIAGLPAGALSIAALDTISDIEPTDDEIVDALVEAFGMDRAQTVERLARFDFAGQRELAEAA